MDERSLRVLEFTKIRDKLKGLAISELGARVCEALTPFRDLPEIKTAQEETEEAVTLLTYLPHHPLVPFEDIGRELRLAALGSTLPPKALLNIAEVMRASRAARDALVTDRENTPRITALGSELSTFRRLEDEIFAAILAEDEIADHASSELATIRRHMRRCNERVREKLNGMIHNPAFAKHLQDAIITMRNDRYVLPVRMESRAFVPGLIHDQSASGATLFIEPLAAVEIGNDLKQWIAKEKIEIERILQVFSAHVTPEAPMLQHNLNVLAKLDFLFAKGLLAKEMRAVQPKINDRGFIRIVKGRHPLIGPQQVVPIDLWIGDAFTCLVVTGPNTGGKTVTLKTVGLFTLMAQAGLQVPADLGTELSVFEDVFADIGDEQSIEQSLSTFSSHMTNIVSIMERVTPRSMALFDELGAGTDPTEGAALAQSILNALLETKTRTLATTHYSELKAFALTTEGVENASVEFDVETLRPTYRLSIGIPGKSNAFEISKRLGLPDVLIGAAREMLSRDQIRFEDVIANAEYHRKIAERERELAEEARLEMMEARKLAEKDRERLLQDREKQIAKARDEAKKIIDRARRESEELIAELKRIKKESGGLREHEIDAARKKLNLAGAELAGLDGSSEDMAAPLKDVKVGDAVVVSNLGTRGVVLSAPDTNGEVMIQAGILKLKARVSQLRRDTQTGKPKARSFTDVDIKTRSVKTECDLRGMALDEAIEAVDKFLDDSMLASVHEVYIIHGKGTGTLRGGVKEHLRKHPLVQAYRGGKYGEGEDGVTVVTLR